MLTQEQLERDLKDVPALPAAVTEILEALNQEGAELDLLESKLSKDPSLVTRTLAIANSPFYGMTGAIASIRESCMILGIATLKHIAMAAGAVNSFPPNSGNQISNRHIWQHAFCTGSAAKVIAAQIGADKEVAFTAGLLHDVGRMVLDHCYPVEYAQVIAFRDNNECSLFDAEMAVLGVSHCRAGEIVAKRWNLPEAITTIIRDHHSPEQDSDNIILELVRVGMFVSYKLEVGDQGDLLVPELSESTMRHIGMELPELMQCLPEISELNQSAGILIG